jgi:hypothetical protein
LENHPKSGFGGFLESLVASRSERQSAKLEWPEEKV